MQPMDTCSWSGSSYGMVNGRDMEIDDQAATACKFFCGVFRPRPQPQPDPFLLLVFLVGSILCHLIHMLTIKRKLDKWKRYVLNVDNSRQAERRTAVYEAISDRLQKLDASLKELGEKISGLQPNCSRDNSNFTLEFPRFSGIQEPVEWLNKVVQLFKYYCSTINENQKVALASFYLEGEGHQWVQWLQQTYRQEGTEISWEIFKKEFFLRFGPEKDEDIEEAVIRVKQTGSLKEYMKEFERLSNRVRSWASEKELVRTFIGGLKEEIAGDVRSSYPKTLHAAVEKARIRDRQLFRQRN